LTDGVPLMETAGHGQLPVGGDRSLVGSARVSDDAVSKADAALAPTGSSTMESAKATMMAVSCRVVNPGPRNRSRVLMDRLRRRIVPSLDRAGRRPELNEQGGRGTCEAPSGHRWLGSDTSRSGAAARLMPRGSGVRRKPPTRKMRGLSGGVAGPGLPSAEAAQAKPIGESVEPEKSTQSDHRDGRPSSL
jgi:hypothetical protein